MQNQPNLLFIMTDQQRWDAMGCSGGWVSTPALDRIAAGGVRFANCVTNSPVCIPARVSLATGHYPHSTGVWTNTRYTLPADTSTWLQAIRQAGYRTSLFGKTHLHPHQGDLREGEPLLHAYGLDDVDEIGGPRASAKLLSHMTEGWQRKGLWRSYQEDYAERFGNKPHVVRPSVLPFDEYADVYVGRRAAAYLAAYDRPEPWFCWVSFGGPHEPWDTPEPYASLHDPEAMPPPAHLLDDYADRPQGGFDRRKRLPLSTEEVRAMRTNYAGNISLIDDQIGNLLKVVEARGELDNTVIAFTSDHGELNGDYDLVYKETFFDGAVRVPMLLNTPASRGGELAGSVSDAFVEWFDIGPTLVELAGGRLDHRQFARSLAPLLSDPGAAHRPYAVSEYDNEIMILGERWKMALNAAGECYLLFDRLQDPAESRNLAGRPEMKETESRLRLQLLEHLLQHQRRL